MESIAHGNLCRPTRITVASGEASSCNCQMAVVEYVGQYAMRISLKTLRVDVLKVSCGICPGPSGPDAEGGDRAQHCAQSHHGVQGSFAQRHQEHRLPLVFFIGLFKALQRKDDHNFNRGFICVITIPDLCLLHRLI